MGFLLGSDDSDVICRLVEGWEHGELGPLGLRERKAWGSEKNQTRSGISAFFENWRPGDGLNLA